MSKNSAVLDRTFSEVKRLCYSDLEEITLLREVAERLRQAVPLDTYCVHWNDPASGLITRAAPAGPEMGEQTHTFLEHVYFEDEVTPFEWMAKRRLSAVLLSESTEGKLERALRYREGMVQSGFRHEVRGVFALNGEMWGSISAWRECASPNFEPRELDFFRRIAPHLAAGLKMAVLRSEVLAEPNRDDAPGVLVLDHATRVIQYTGAAERWLRELGDLDPNWHEGGDLPSVVLSVKGALRHSLGGDSKDREWNGGVPRLLVQGRTGRWLELHGALTESASGRSGETTIVIEPARPRAVAWLKTSAYGLSDREREVVDLVARSLSTKEISNTLHISEYTVQDHLSNIFDKVGVRGRRALVKRLYLESLF